jgi:type I restriction enzyme S subunit
MTEGKVKIADLIEFSRDGEWGAGEPSSDGVEMLVVRGTDFESISNGNWRSVPTRFLKRKHAELKEVRPGAILIETAGGTKDRPTGRTVYLRPSMFRGLDKPVTCASFARFIRVREEQVDAEWLFWLFQAWYANGVMRKYHTQHTGVARFQWTTFSEAEGVVLPDRAAQRKVASILTAYDDLIENNLRRIKLLEEMAQLLFREWFVQFRVPGHEGVQFVDAGGGPLPKGWRRGTIGQLCTKMKSGGTPSRSNPAYWDGGQIPWLKTKEMRDSFVLVAEERITEAGLAGSSASLFPAGTLVIAMYGTPTAGNLGILTEPSAFNQAALAVVPDEGKTTREFLFYALMSLRQYFHTIWQGAAQQNLSKEKISSTVIVIPPVEIARRFSTEVLPMWDLILNLRRANQNLRQARDLLLPRLISGELDVSQLPIEVPA